MEAGLWDAPPTEQELAAANAPRQPSILQDVGAFAQGLSTNVPGLETARAAIAAGRRDPAAAAGAAREAARYERGGALGGASHLLGGTMGPLQGEPGPASVESQAAPPVNQEDPFHQVFLQEQQRLQQEEEALSKASPGAYWTGALGPMAVAPVRAGLRGAASLAGRAAEWNAVRALGAAGAWGKVAAREGAERVPQLGRVLLDEGVPLKTPGEALRGVKEALSQKYGPAIARLTQEADLRGASFDLGRVLSDFRSGNRAEMMKDPQQQPIVAAVEEYLSKVAKARGSWDQQGRQLLQLAPSEAWGLRRNLDVFLRGVKRQLDPEGTLTKSTFNGIRRAVDDELTRAMDSVGLAEQWRPANRGYRDLSAAMPVARAGQRAQVVREAGQPEPVLKRLRELRLPGPSAATKAGAQDFLYRLGHPRGPELSLTPPPFKFISGGAPTDDELRLTYREAANEPQRVVPGWQPTNTRVIGNIRRPPPGSLADEVGAAYGEHYGSGARFRSPEAQARIDALLQREESASEFGLGRGAPEAPALTAAERKRYQLAYGHDPENLDPATVREFLRRLEE